MRRDQIDRRAQAQRAESQQARPVAPGKVTPASKLSGHHGQPPAPSAVQMRPARNSSLEADLDAAHRGVQASPEATLPRSAERSTT